MNYKSILNKRLSCFLIAEIFVSIIVVAQTGISAKASMPGGENNLNIAPFGMIKSWCNIADPLGKTISYNDFNSNSSADSSDIGIFWWDARDIQRIEVVYDTKITEVPSGLPVVQYWHHTWPEPPPKMPTIEDQEDDPWQGKWITAATVSEANGNTLIFTFKPLTTQENPNAGYLPGSITYRRTLKVRLLYPDKYRNIKAINSFSASKEKNSSIRIELGCNKNNNLEVEGSLEIFNGRVKNISSWHWDNKDKKTGINSWKLNLNGKPKGIIANIYTAVATLPGSNDETVVTLRSSQGTFSFSVNDLEKGPVYVPYFNTYITKSSDTVSFLNANPVKGKTIRERIRDQPEQSYDRARNEIPHLDPIQDQYGNRIYLPLASDANWQKFAVQWGGNIFMDKHLTKAQDKELARCNWNGGNLTWKIGTGAEPVFNRTEENCQMSILNDYLPVINSRWKQDGLNYSEEVFTTLLHGPLSPSDPVRNEQTPAILMIKLTISNPSNHNDTCHIWLSGNKALSGLKRDGDFLMDQIEGKNYIRCYMPSVPKGIEKNELLADAESILRIIHRQIPLGPNSSQAIYFYFPFVGDLTADTQQEIASLVYESQKNRVISYWRDLVSQVSIYNVPERKFNEMAKAVIPHIRMSATRDPKSSLYMVPAASLGYGVYANESVFQTLLLDRLGDFTTSSDYLNTFMELQGSRKLPGRLTGDQKDVFYGVRIDSANDITANGYNMHHGTVLWGLASHYLFSGDREWLLKAAPHMISAANWIIEQLKHTKQKDEKGNKVIQYGLLPAGNLEDNSDWRFWYATNAYACLGMETMAKAFAKAGLPQADFFRAEASSYHTDIRRSIELATELSPVVRLRNNTYVPYVPVRPYQRFRYFGSKKSEYYDRYNKGIYPNLRLSATREALYGPIVLIKAGLIDADEPMSDWILNDWEDNLTLSTSLNLNAHGLVDDEYWFSRGGMVFQANLQNPVDTYLKRHEIKAALRDMYNSFVSCLYPDVNAQTEEYRMWGHGSGPFYKIPDEARFVSQVCDLLVMEKGNELWLANGVPQSWLEAGQKVELMNAHTEYGEVSYSLRPGKLAETIEADIQLPEGTCSKVFLFVRSPFQKPIRQVTINGQNWKEWDADKEFVVIPQTTKNVQVTISY
jgi:hypothetical protein